MVLHCRGLQAPEVLWPCNVRVQVVGWDEEVAGGRRSPCWGSDDDEEFEEMMEQVKSNTALPLKWLMLLS